MGDIPVGFIPPKPLSFTCHAMRKILSEQSKPGVIDISQIKIDLNSRDQFPRMLLGSQCILYPFGSRTSNAPGQYQLA